MTDSNSFFEIKSQTPNIVESVVYYSQYYTIVFKFENF